MLESLWHLSSATLAKQNREVNCSRFKVHAMLSCTLLLFVSNGFPQGEPVDENSMVPLRLHEFRWTLGAPILSPPSAAYDGIMEPSVVYYRGKWHLFCTLQGEQRNRTVEYLSFSAWEDLSDLDRHIVPLSNADIGAPQILYLTPWRRWLLLSQMQDKSGKATPAFSLSSDLTDPNSWTTPRRIEFANPVESQSWRDFWLICSDRRAFLFWTAGSDGELWRSETTINAFPEGWSRPVLALQGNFFKGVHIYRIAGRSGFLAILEAHRRWRRYYKAYWTDNLQGRWHPLAITRTQAFASRANVNSTGPVWTDSFSHGEIIRSGFDEKLEISLENLRFVFQGVTYRARDGKRPKQIPWKIGLLNPR